MAHSAGLIRRYTASLTLIGRALDVVFCLVAGILAYLLRFDNSNVLALPGYPILVLAGAILVFLVFPAVGVYQPWRAKRLWLPVSRALLAWVLVFVLLLVLLVLVRRSEYYSRIWLFEWFVFQACFLVFVRLSTYGALRRLRQSGFNLHNVVIVGAGRQAQTLIREAKAAPSMGFDVVSVFSDADDSDRCEGYKLQPLQTLAAYMQSNRVDEVWIALPLERSREMQQVLPVLQNSVANVRYVPDLKDLFLLNHGVTELLNTYMIDLTVSPMQGTARFFKAVEDRVLATLILVLVSPLMVAVALGVKFSSRGPVLFRQRRNGWDGQEITVYKFRTMRLHEERPGCVTQVSPNDQRLTRFGAFLRRTSLDELPQFINVLQGRMSVVGPRPHAIEHNVQYRRIIERYMLRHVVKPGITGWAQINGLRGMTETPDKMQMRVDYDLFYINNWSLWFDFKIVFLTLFRGFVNKNAY